MKPSRNRPALGRRLVRAVQSLLPPTGNLRGTTVFAYHLVGAGTDSPVDLPRKTFQRQMVELAEIAEVVPLADAVRDPEGRGHLRPQVALTFDDAYVNFYDTVWPVLRKLDLPATLFVPVGFVEGTSPAPITGTADLAPCSWSQLDELSREGGNGSFKIGSHTWSHPDLTTLEEPRIREELSDSHRRLEDRLGRRVTAFCYPRARWNRRVETLVAEIYELAVVGGGARLRRRTPRLRVPRISIRRDMPGSLAGLLRHPVWLEEWIADHIRPLHP